MSVLCAAALAFGCASSVKTTQRTRLTTKELVQKSKPAVVRITVESRGGEGVGTGFVISPDGRIVTNLHVIVGADDVKVALLDGTELPVLQVLAIDEERDLAIIKVEAGRALPVLQLGNSDEVSAGDPVVAIGNPLGVLDYTVSDGIISSVRPITESLTVLQITAPISQGSSGGPLFNPYGEVIGVVRAFIGQGQNLNFGIPSNYLRPLMARNEGWTLETLSAKFQLDSPRIERRVPAHEVSLLDDCGDEAILNVIRGITEAISVGAPLYNQGNHEACYRIYEGIAVKLERELECPGLRAALGQGLLRAGTLDDYTLKAWAMRDAFDGILNLVERKAREEVP
jgi:serine protease Do